MESLKQIILKKYSSNPVSICELITYEKYSLKLENHLNRYQHKFSLLIKTIKIYW